MRCAKCSFNGTAEVDYALYGLVWTDTPRQDLTFAGGFELWERSPLAEAPTNVFIEADDPDFAALRQVSASSSAFPTTTCQRHRAVNTLQLARAQVQASRCPCASRLCAAHVALFVLHSASAV